MKVKHTIKLSESDMKHILSIYLKQKGVDVMEDTEFKFLNGNANVDVLFTDIEVSGYSKDRK